MIRPCAVGFDFDRTLGVDNSLERRAFGRLAAELHAPIWWGAIMLALGLFYALRFRPGKA